jgi:hypothetical protein
VTLAELTDMQTWLEGPEAAGFFRVTRWVIDAEAWRERLGFHGGEQKTNSEIIAETFGSAGAYVMGRRMADGGEIPWGEDPRSVPRCPWSPTGPGRRCKGGAAPASPTSPPGSKCHRPSPGRRGREERGDRGRRHTLRQVIQLGLLDELELHIVPVILGDGMRLLGPDLRLDSTEAIELTPARVIATPDVTHIRYKMDGRHPLVLDNRGRDEAPTTV